jgi:hypothetical protein
MRAAVPVKQTSTTAVLATISIGWGRLFEVLVTGMFMMILSGDVNLGVTVSEPMRACLFLL